MDKEEKYMRLALREAKRALKNGDVPIGCVIVYDGLEPDSKADKHAFSMGVEPDTVIGKGYNRRNRDHSSLMHAELIAIRKACKTFNDWRLEDCTMYVTLEPCPMCAGAILQSRIPRVVIGARSLKTGSGGTVIDLLRHPAMNHQCEVRFSILEESSKALISEFFSIIRN